MFTFYIFFFTDFLIDLAPYFHLKKENYSQRFIDQTVRSLVGKILENKYFTVAFIREFAGLKFGKNQSTSFLTVSEKSGKILEVNSKI